MFPFLCTPILVIPLLAQRPFKESNAYNKRLSICSGACPFYSSIPAAGTKRRSAPASPFCPVWGTNTVEINPAVRRICFSLLAGFYCKQGTRHREKQPMATKAMRFDERPCFTILYACQ